MTVSLGAGVDLAGVPGVCRVNQLDGDPFLDVAVVEATDPKMSVSFVVIAIVGIDVRPVRIAVE